MSRNYWMFVQTPANFEISKGFSFSIHGFNARYRRRVQRMEPDDRVLYYISGIRKWAVTASITSGYFQDHTPIWECRGDRDVLPYRVNLSPTIVLNEMEYIDGLTIGPRLEYIKRWAPENWPLAFMDSLHLLPQRDFRLIETEMKRVMSKCRNRSRGSKNGSDGLK